MVTEWRLLKADPLLLARLPGGQGPLLHPLADDPGQLALGVIIQLVVHLLVDVLQQPVDKNLTQQTLLLLDLSLRWLLLQGWWQHLLLELLIASVHVEVYAGWSSMFNGLLFVHTQYPGWAWARVTTAASSQETSEYLLVAPLTIVGGQWSSGRRGPLPAGNREEVAVYKKFWTTIKDLNNWYCTGAPAPAAPTLPT